MAKVVTNTARKFVYREDFQHGQRIVHSISVKPSGKHTILAYEKKWKGSFIMLPLRWLNLFQKGTSLSGPSGGMEGMRRALNEAWEENGV